MAQLEIEESQLRLRLSRLERLGALHVDVVVPLANVDSVQTVDNAFEILRGIRAPGAGIPGYLMLGIKRGQFGRDFCAVRGHGPAVVVELHDAPFARLIASCANADEVASIIRRTCAQQIGESSEGN